MDTVEMDVGPVLEYVKVAAVMMGLPMDEGRARRVAEHLQRTAAMSLLIEQAALDVSEEPAEIYRLERPALRDR